MTATLTRSLTAWLPAADFVPAGTVFLNCATLASPAEMARTGNSCVWCSTVMVAKVGDGMVAGRMLGQRAGVSDEWTWSGPFCQACDKAHGRILD